MSGSLEGNKIVAAVLTAGVVAMVSGFVAKLVYHPENLETPVYTVAAEEAAPATATATETAEMPAMTIAGMLASAKVGPGEKQAKKCTSCHTFNDGGANKIGPNLWNLVDRPIASDAKYSYSEALKSRAGETWSYENLDAFLAKPKTFAPGTKMSFAGVKKDDARANLIMYLRSMSGSPAPLPQ